MQEQKFEVRAMPAMGFSHRWCAQRPWGKEPKVVVVKEGAAPPVETVDSEGKKRLSYPDEITPSALEELRKDPHISVSIAGSPDGDPLEMNTLKARIIELEQKIEAARKEHQGEIEDLKAARVQSAKVAEELGAKVILLEQQLASANDLISKKALKK